MTPTAPTPVESLIRERIRREGPLSFRDVMQTALYHPEYGYYTCLRGFGPDGDFITSSERHPAFGWLLARQAKDVWDALGQPRPFRILELGAGGGAMAASLLDALGADVPDIIYTIDEPSPSLREVQRERLHRHAVRWDSPRASEKNHLIVANEVIDALPVLRARAHGSHLHELVVGLDDDGQFTWVEATEPHAAMDAYMADVHYTPPEGTVLNICLELEGFVQLLSDRLDTRGMALVLDYTASPPRDSVLTYYRHTMGSDPLVRLGQQDISAHVDLRTLVRLGIRAGFKTGATAQRGLLFNLGFGQVLTRLSGQTDREALNGLVASDGLGGQIAVVFFVRGLPDFRPAGAVGGMTWPEPSTVPGLPPAADESAFIEQWREAFPAES
ncbi:MAG: SAM-dependent methyltransferase [Chloroflexota bacterium]